MSNLNHAVSEQRERVTAAKSTLLFGAGRRLAKLVERREQLVAKVNEAVTELESHLVWRQQEVDVILDVR